MKYTSIAIIVIGACILLGCAVASAMIGQATADLIFPSVMGVVAIGIGIVMYVYGGRGIISTRNPAIRN